MLFKLNASMNHLKLTDAEMHRYDAPIAKIKQALIDMLLKRTGQDTSC